MIELTMKMAILSALIGTSQAQFGSNTADRPIGCTSWFDGCNSCSPSDPFDSTSRMGCTKQGSREMEFRGFT